MFRKLHIFLLLMSLVPWAQAVELTVEAKSGIESIHVTQPGSVIVTSPRGIGRFYIKTSRLPELTIFLRYNRAMPIVNLEGLNIVDAATGQPVPPHRYFFRAGIISVNQSPVNVNWIVQFIDFHR